MEFRGRVDQVIRAAFDPFGTDVNVGLFKQFMVLVAAGLSGVFCMALSWNRGMAPIGAGMAMGSGILILFTGYRLLGIPWAWPVGTQIILVSLGGFSIARQFGLWR